MSMNYQKRFLLLGVVVFVLSTMVPYLAQATGADGLALAGNETLTIRLIVSAQLQEILCFLETAFSPSKGQPFGLAIRPRTPVPASCSTTMPKLFSMTPLLSLERGLGSGVWPTEFDEASASHRRLCPLTGWCDSLWQ